MVLDTIYIVRHGSRADWVVDPGTGAYASRIPNPTGLDADPPLSARGVGQAKELAQHLKSMDPPIDTVYASPFYRVIQTLAPVMEALGSPTRGQSEQHNASKSRSIPINLEPGLGDYFGTATWIQPHAPTKSLLAPLFPTLTLDDSQGTIIKPDPHGESLPTIHDRFAYCMQELIKRLDADGEHRTLLIGTHAAGVICLCRVLTGDCTDDYTRDEWSCAVCSVSKFTRRTGRRADPVAGESRGLNTAQSGGPEPADTVPFVDWRGGMGVSGGWDCSYNGDTSFLQDGAEASWHFTHQETMKP